MAHSMVKVWVHAVWSVKDRQALLKQAFRSDVLKHVREGFQAQDCTVHIVNGTDDHLHALFLLPPEKSLAHVMKMVKGESSH